MFLCSDSFPWLPKVSPEPSPLPRRRSALVVAPRLGSRLQPLFPNPRPRRHQPRPPPYPAPTRPAQESFLRLLIAPKQNNPLALTPRIPRPEALVVTAPFMLSRSSPRSIPSSFSKMPGRYLPHRCDGEPRNG